MSMLPVSVVIMCKNEAAAIAATITAAQQLQTEIIVIDTGSTDDTVAIVQSHPNVKLIQAEWQGFGPTKNIGIDAATNDWIFSLDADEVIDEKLVTAIKAINFNTENTIYKVHFLNYLGDTPLRFGEWSGDTHVRIFNRKYVRWNNAEVHEELIYTKTFNSKLLNGYVHHKTSNTVAEMKIKMDSYARLHAAKYLRQGKKYRNIKKIISPVFNFVKNYIFKLGFLDGKAGWQVAKENFIYTYKKYHYLKQQ